MTPTLCRTQWPGWKIHKLNWTSEDLCRVLPGAHVVCRVSSITGFETPMSHVTLGTWPKRRLVTWVSLTYACLELVSSWFREACRELLLTSFSRQGVVAPHSKQHRLGSLYEVINHGEWGTQLLDLSTAIDRYVENLTDELLDSNIERRIFRTKQLNGRCTVVEEIDTRSTLHATAEVEKLPVYNSKTRRVRCGGIAGASLT